MLRTLTQVALMLGLVGVAGAQTTEIIIRRSGQKDQVIRLDDKQTREMAAKVSDQLKGAMKDLKEIQISREGNLARITFDSAQTARIAMQAKVLAERTGELASRNGEIAARAGQLAKLQPGMMARVMKDALSQPRLGIFIDNSRPQESDKYGAMVDAVTPGGPADKAGIRSGDIITRIDGKSLAAGKSGSATESLPGMRLIEIMSKLEAGKPVTVEYRRGTTTNTTKVTPVEENEINITAMAPNMAWSVDSGPGVMLRRFTSPALAGTSVRTPEAISVFGNSIPGSNFAYAFSVGGPLSNLELVSLNEKLGAYFGTSEGVLVVDVGEKDAFGLQPGDVIASVDGRKVTTSSQLMRILRTYDKGEVFKIQIMRQKKAETLTGKLP